ncbi:MAG: hypothetical protein KJ709_00190 [Nanoarchaeota archaeon]|nr:hypothetical protein [Nanoarchaeota archaeon]
MDDTKDNLQISENEGDILLESRIRATGIDWKLHFDEFTQEHRALLQKLLANTTFEYELQPIAKHDHRYLIELRGQGMLDDAKQMLALAAEIQNDDTRLYGAHDESAAKVAEIIQALGLASLSELEPILSLNIYKSAFCLHHEGRSTFLLHKNDGSPYIVTTDEGHDAPGVPIAPLVPRVPIEPGIVPISESTSIINNLMPYFETDKDGVKDALYRMAIYGITARMENVPVKVTARWDGLSRLQHGMHLAGVHSAIFPYLSVSSQEDGELEDTLKQLYAQLQERHIDPEAELGEFTYSNEWPLSLESKAYADFQAIASRQGKEDLLKANIAVVRMTAANALDELGLPIDADKLDYSRGREGLMAQLRDITREIKNNEKRYGFLPFDHIIASDRLKTDLRTNDDEIWIGSKGEIEKRCKTVFSVRLEDGSVHNYDIVDDQKEVTMAERATGFPDWYKPMACNIGDKIVTTDKAREWTYEGEVKNIKGGMDGEVINICGDTRFYYVQPRNRDAHTNEKRDSQANMYYADRLKDEEGNIMYGQEKLLKHLERRISESLPEHFSSQLKVKPDDLQFDEDKEGNFILFHQTQIGGRPAHLYLAYTPDSNFLITCVGGEPDRQMAFDIVRSAKPNAEKFAGLAASTRADLLELSCLGETQEHYVIGCKSD